MRPALKALAEDSFDVLIVGAGIHGACAAWAATSLGLKTALIDQDDFGAATSANSLKVIHGGLRYLQHGNLKRMRESIRARRRFLSLAPHLVRPQPFVVPTFGGGMRGKNTLRIALKLNDLVSWDRNAGLLPEQQLPAGRILSVDEARSIWPSLYRDVYDGAALWYDALCHDTERLTLFFALAAQSRGAVIANYVKAARLLIEGGATAGIEAKDVLGDAAFPIRARAVINAAGPWWKQWPGAAAGNHPLVGAWNVIVKSQWFGRYGVGLESTHVHHDAEAILKRGRRNLFFVPWRGGTMIGTVYEPFVGDPATYRPSRAAIESFIDEINGVLPAAKLTPDRVTLLHIGVQPAAPVGSSPEPDKHSEVVPESVRGFFSIKGVKYTTGLTVGETAAVTAARALGRPAQLPKDPKSRSLNSADIRSSARERGLDLPDAVCERLARQYGAVTGDVLDEARADGGARLAGAPQYLCAEVRYAVKKESALRLADVLLRRTGLGTFQAPDETTRRAVLSELAPLLGWSAAQQAEELKHVEAGYARLTIPA